MLIAGNVIRGVVVSASASAPPPPPNDPPSWTGTPTPTRPSIGGGTYNVHGFATDPDGDTLIYNVTANSAALPDGVTFSADGVLHFNSASTVAAITSGILIGANDTHNAVVTSPAFNLAITSAAEVKEGSYPRIGTIRIGTFNYSINPDLYAEASADQLAMALHDVVLVGGFNDTPQDGASPGPNYQSRTDVSQNLLDQHATHIGNDDLYLFTYVIQMSASDQNGSNQFGDKCLSETGPNGTNWFYHDAQGNIVYNTGESPGGGGMINLSDQVTLDSGGLNYSEWYADTRIIGELLAPHAAAGIGVGKGGMNIWCDNLGYKIRKSGIDPDQNGTNNDQGDYYDPDNISHMTGVDQYGAQRSQAVQFVGEYRATQRTGLERAQAAYPTLLIGGNSNQYAQGYSGPATSQPHVMKEYRIDAGDINSKAFQQVGLSENNNWRPTELKSGWQRSHTLWTGVSSTSGGNWQTSYNNIAMPTWNMTDPAIHFGEWIVDCLENGTTLFTDNTSRQVWSPIPRAGSAWNAHRWGMVTCWLAGSYYCCSGVIDGATNTVAERRATPLFDEFGLINGAVDYGFGTGISTLTYKWMGEPIDPVQKLPRQGSNIWMREFDNALIIINTNWDDTLADITVDVSALPGGATAWRRINGTQDPVWNDGSDVDADFDIPSIDAIVLVRKVFIDPQIIEYPRTYTARGSNRSPFQTGALAATDRIAIGLMDACHTIGLDSGTHMDTSTPAAGYLSRAAAVQEILDAHPTSEHYLFTYHNVTEAFDRDTPARAKKIRDFLDGMNGPGADDGWAYNNQNNKVLLFGFQYTINNSDYVAEFGGQTYSEWYATEIAQLEYLDVMAAAGIGVGKGGANIFLDNHQHHSNKSSIDWNNDGSNDDAQDYYDSEEAAHVAADPVATQAYSESRANFRKAVDTWDAANPGVNQNGHVTLLNTNQWDDKPLDRLDFPQTLGELRNCILEYRLGTDPNNSYAKGGFSENNAKNANPDSPPEPQTFPRSGVGSDGNNRGQGGTWYSSYWNVYQSVRLCQYPQIVACSWSVECLQSGTAGDGGVTIYPNVPASNAVFHMCRWVMATAALAGANANISGVVVGSEKSGSGSSTPLFDEMGIINGSVDYGFGTGGTKLFHKWMGQAKEPAATGPQADGSWQREFDNALVVLNPDNDRGSNGPISIDVSAFPGGASEWKRFDGDQDTFNFGNDTSSDFFLNSTDAIFLVRKSWYDAL